MYKEVRFGNTNSVKLITRTFFFYVFPRRRKNELCSLLTIRLIVNYVTYVPKT